ncbi:MAG: hypothetical protein JNL13_00020 [Chitinophagaceae bacterium]|nr:hypothetical protein [Chitinophagaceae bacterium]
MKRFSIVAIALLTGITGFVSCKKKDEIKPLAANELVTLPVIFHILHGGEPAGTGTNISAAYIKRCMDSLNAHFAGKTVQGNNTYIQFRLAGKDEDGNSLAEQGIHRVKYGTGYFDMGLTMADDTFTKSLTWDPNRYINIFVCYYPYSPTSSPVAAYATLPWASSDHPIQGLDPTNASDYKKQVKSKMGLFMNSLFLLDSAFNSFSYAATSHEMGHYLGLSHVFNKSSCVLNGDYCADTHDYLRMYEPTTYARSGCDGYAFTSINFMDYGPNYYWQFTPDQITRMREVVNYAPFRAKLVNSQALETRRTTVPDAEIFVPQVSIPDETGMMPERPR